jgi:hypothetical protein
MKGLAANMAYIVKSGIKVEFVGWEWVNLRLFKTRKSAAAFYDSTIKQIKPEDVSILYVDRVGDYGSVIKRMRLDEYGDFIDSWPDGFFVDAFSDLTSD